MPSLNTGNAILSNPIKVDSSYNVGIGGAASGSYKLNVTGTANFTSDVFGLTGFYTRNSADTFIGSTNNTSGIIVNGTTLVTKIVSGGNTVATFANAGAATFSSSVTASGNFVLDNASRFKNFETNASGTRTSYYSWDNTNNDLTIATIGSNPIRLSPNQATAVYISGGGNVGIGTSSPATKLHINTTATAENVFKITNSTLDLTLGVNTDSGGSFLFENSNNALRFGTNASERMRITSGGNVGIGIVPQTWSTSYKSLQVSNASLLNDIGTNTYLGTNTYIGSDNQWKYIVSNGASIMGLETGSWVFYNAASGTAGANISWSERMRITSGGNVGIGLTPASIVRLHVKGVDSTDNNLAFAVINSSSSDLFYARNDGALNTGLAANSPYNLTTGNAANATLGSDGFMRRNTSSLKYKTDVKDYDKGLDIVNQMRPVYYKGINDGDKQFAGLIAEEIHELGLIEFVQYAEDGTPDALAYQNMIALAFKAIQELNQTVQNQQQQINSLINR